jgi:hypothetical protein
MLSPTPLPLVPGAKPGCPKTAVMSTPSRVIVIPPPPLASTQASNRL